MPRLRILKDSFYNNSTERQTVTAGGSLVQRELSAKLTEGLFWWNFNYYNPSVTALPCRLPLHRGGFLLACKFALTHRQKW